MKKSVINVSTLLLFTGLIQAQLLRSPVTDGYRRVGVGSRQHTDVFTTTANPAALAQLSHSSAGIFTERRFLLKELTGYIVSAGLVTKHGNIGMIMRHAGFREYGESQFSLLHARALGTKTGIGIQFNYSITRISNYGSSHSPGFELASVWHLSEKIYAGIQVANILKNKKSAQPSLYTATWGYEASEKLYAGVTISKEEEQPVNVQAAVQYRFHPACMARLGVSSATSSAWSGAALSWKNSRLDIIAAYHPQLGITPAMALSFIMGGKKNEP